MLGTLANMSFSTNVYWVVSNGDGSADIPTEMLAFPPHAANDFVGLQALGKDTTSVVSDPLFANFSARNFTLLPDSPALSLGFEQIDTSMVGPRA